MTPLFVTGNPGKLREARRLWGRPLEALALDLPEIQSLDLEEVLSAKLEAARAAAPAGGTIVVEEAGLELSALNGFPGPFVRYLLEAVGAEGIARIGVALGDRRVRAVCRLAWSDGQRTLVGRGECAGTLALPGRGEYGFGFDPVFVPDGSELTFGEMDESEKDVVSHRGNAWRDLARQLSEA